jgi:hypothetical protein
MPGKKRHSKKFDRCVKDVRRSGTPASPYAVCTRSVGNPRRRRRGMPRALAAYWRKHRAKRAPPRKRKRVRSNPGPGSYVIVARRKGARLLFNGADAFHANPSRAHRYRSPRDARAHAQTLRRAYRRRLGRYRVGVEYI